MMNQSDYYNLVSHIEHLKESASQMDKYMAVYLGVIYILVN